MYVIQKIDEKVTSFAEWEDTLENRNRLKEWSKYGFVESENKYVIGWDGDFYKEGEEPEEPLERINDKIRNERRVRMVQEADDLKHDYDEALARGADNAEELKNIWLAKKDEIRNDLPYKE